MRRVPILLLVAFLTLAGSGPAWSSPAWSSPAHPRSTRTAAAPAPVGGYAWPLPGTPQVSRMFDPPENPYGRGHRGVDLVGAPGTPVLAAGAGTVVFAGSLAGRGVVSVQHADGLRTTYEPVTASVVAGQRVARGEVLGALVAGHPGCAAAACLHWGVRRGATEYLDPLRLIGAWQVRLLPWR